VYIADKRWKEDKNKAKKKDKEKKKKKKKKTKKKKKDGILLSSIGRKKWPAAKQGTRVYDLGPR